MPERDPMAAEIDIIVPICNEEAVADELVTRLRRSCPGANLIFVDNASTDRTCEILGELGVTVIEHSSNLGYGRSLSDGIAAGRGDVIVMIDSDLEYRPEDIPALVTKLGTFEAVYGSRFASLPDSLNSTSRLPGFRGFGNRFVTALFNLLFAQNLSDLYTGIRAVRRESLPSGGLDSPGFEFVLELAARLAQQGIEIAEIPVSYAPRSTGRSKMRHIPELLKFAFRLAELRIAGAPRPHG